MKMENIILQIAVRKSKSNFKLQITEQSSRFISFTDTKGYELTCSSMPQVKSTIFYLRGSDSEYDTNWIDLNENYISPLMNALCEYAQSNTLEICLEIQPKQAIITIHLIDDYKLNYNKDYNNLLTLKIMNLEISKTLDFKTIISCESCGIKSESCERIVNVTHHITLCKKCRDKMLSCEKCGYLAHSLQEHTNSIGQRRKLCIRCIKFFNCEICSIKELNMDKSQILEITEDGRDSQKLVCLKCRKNYTKCLSCERFYPPHYPKCVCKLPHEFKPLGVKDWNTEVTEILYADSDPEVGMELEVGVHVCNRLKYEEVYKHTLNIIGNDAIMVYDASIDYIDGSKKTKPNCFRGFEIVTRPLNYDNMIKFVNNLSDKRHQLLRSWDVKTTGIHIHFNKKKLTKIEIGKLHVFINEMKNRSMIKHIARRVDTHYAKLINKKITDYSRIIKDDKAIIKNICHYDALNVTKPRTIEFRIFRGSLKKETLLSYIQFVYSSIEFVKNTPISLLTSVNYVKWIMTRTNKSEYRELKQRLSTYGKRGQLEVGGED